jgi:hypothetical protein
MNRKTSVRESKKGGKSGIRRWVPAILSCLVLLIVILLVCVLSNLNGIVKAGIEKYGSRAVGTAVRVESVRIQLKEGSAAVQGLTIGNPEGFNSKNAFILGEIGVVIDVRSISDDVKVIDDITVRKPEIFAEMNEDRTFNLNVILRNLSGSALPSKKESSAPESGKVEAEEKREVKEEPRLIIRHILFTDGVIRGRLEFGGNGDTVLRLPTVEMRNLGAPNGATPTELSRIILGELSRRAMAEVRKKAVSAATQKVKNEAESAVRKRLLKGF